MEGEHVDHALDADLFDLQAALALAQQLAVAKQEHLRGVAADRHVHRKLDASTKQAAADELDRVIGLLEQAMLLLQADQTCAKSVIGGLSLGGLAEIEMEKPIPRFFRTASEATALNGREASTA